MQPTLLLGSSFFFKLIVPQQKDVFVFTVFSDLLREQIFCYLKYLWLFISSGQRCHSEKD